MKNPFIETCPNCESAWTGGHPNPESITFCVVCSDPKTGEVRGWVWRWNWLHYWLVSRHNIEKTREELVAKEIINNVVNQAISRRAGNWAPALSRHARRLHSKVREEHYINWPKLKLSCEQEDLDYNLVVNHVKRLAKEFKVTIR